MSFVLFVVPPKWTITKNTRERGAGVARNPNLTLIATRRLAAKERKERKKKKNLNDGPGPVTLRSMRSFAAITNHDLTTG